MNARLFLTVREKFIENLGGISEGQFRAVMIGTACLLTWMLCSIWSCFLTVSVETIRDNVGLQSELQDLRNLRVAINKRYEISAKKQEMPAYRSLMDEFITELYRIADQHEVRIIEILSRGAEGGLQQTGRLDMNVTGAYPALVHFLNTIQGAHSNLFVESFLLQGSLSGPKIKQLELVLKLSEDRFA